MNKALRNSCSYSCTFCLVLQTSATALAWPVATCFIWHLRRVQACTSLEFGNKYELVQQMSAAALVWLLATYIISDFSYKFHTSTRNSCSNNENSFISHKIFECFYRIFRADWTLFQIKMNLYII